MNFYGIFPLIAGILTFGVGFFVFWNNKKSIVNITFALFSLSCSIWLFGYFCVYLIKNEIVALNLIKFLYIGVIFIPIFLNHFVNVFLGIRKKRFFLYFTYILGFASILLLFTTNTFVSGVFKYFWGFYAKAGITHSFYLCFFGFIVLRSLFILNKFLNEKKGRAPLEYLRIKYVFLAFAVGFLGGFQDFIPNYGAGKFYPFGCIFVSIGTALVAYAIIRYRLLDITIALTRAGIFTFVYTLVLGIPFGIGGLIKPSLSKVTSNWWLLPVFLMAVLASLGPFIYMKLQKRLESRIRAQEFKSHEALRRLSHNMLRFTKLEILLKLIVHFLVKILRLRFAAIYIFDTQSDKYLLKSSWQIEEKFNLPESFSKESSLIKDLYLRRLPVVTEELRLVVPKTPFSSHIGELLNILSSLKINTVIPSFIRNGLLGFLILSDRRNNLAFSQENLNLLMVLSNEAALAIENAQFHQKEKSLLAERSRREALADMAPGASHQFNNRLACISFSAELSLFKLEKINIDELQDENIKAVLKHIKDSLELIDREVYKGKEITSAILKRAKAKTDFQEIDIQNLIENAYRLVLISRSKSGLGEFKEPNFKIIFLNEIPKIYASEALLQDSTYNIIDNSFDAIQKRYSLIAQGELPWDKDLAYQGEIEVILKKEDENLIIQINDNGIGLTKEQKRRLFTPYFTTKATSNKGTGLGLYVIRDFIEMHQGTITCESEYGIVTTFTIRLPIKQKGSL